MREKYTVYDRRTDLPVAVCETSSRCAEAMGVKLASFHRLAARYKSEGSGRWSIRREGLCLDLLEDRDRLHVIGNRIKNLRQIKRMSRDEVALASGLTKGRIFLLENARVDASASDLYCLSRGFGVSIERIVGE